MVTLEEAKKKKEAYHHHHDDGDDDDDSGGKRHRVVEGEKDTGTHAMADKMRGRLFFCRTSRSTSLLMMIHSDELIDQIFDSPAIIGSNREVLSKQEKKKKEGCMFFPAPPFLVIR